MLFGDFRFPFGKLPSLCQADFFCADLKWISLPRWHEGIHLLAFFRKLTGV
jgi:hypothetical protein